MGESIKRPRSEIYFDENITESWGKHRQNRLASIENCHAIITPPDPHVATDEVIRAFVSVARVCGRAFD